MLKKTILSGLFSRPAARGSFALLAMALMASGCGQKGPLFLPAPASAATPRPATTPPVPPAVSPDPADPTQPANNGTTR
ncbi:LPS translocon maturation chaperone LptM [Hydrogenophaga sp. A37]|uniref:LPS translocon maturation chaperone LptM n=1 Tax=Hydrogenophaga sp. A37 TaxID=1945864 RepID=UPI000985A4D8|nr:lipoprotein [Hydrogenophaga sp. A37]OOG84878.1 hypothetical protein B0E41_09595 [Hydrogenophaga sp. A37]